MKYLSAVLAVALFISPAAAELNSDIRKSCGDDEPLISMADPNDTYSNPGPPDMYEWQVCVEGIEESEITDSCERTSGFYLSSEKRTAHFSAHPSYNKHVCTGRMKTRVTSEPKKSDEILLFTASNRSNGHIAKENIFEYNVYGSYAAPDNVTLSMNFNLSSSDEVYFDGEKIDGEETFRPPANFPYLISETDSVASGVAAPSFLRSERKIRTRNSLRLTTRAGKSSFYVPMITGNRQDIESRQETIVNNEFMNRIAPSFSGIIPESPTVHVIYSPETDLNSEMEIYPGSYSINITKTGEKQILLEK